MGFNRPGPGEHVYRPDMGDAATGEDDVEGHAFRLAASAEDNDTEGHSMGKGYKPGATEDDVEGHGKGFRPGASDDEDVEGHKYNRS